jgi:hypothetical protein
LKSADGVLLTDGTHVKLWKASDMARMVTAHAVHHGDREGTKSTQKRNLFTVESMAPTLFTGLVSMPKTAADLLLKSLKENPFIQLGKSRSVRGGGELKAEIVEFSELPIMKKHEETVFILQSPLLVPQNLVKKSVSEIISILAADSGFGEVEIASGSITTQFGWNEKINKGFLGGRSVIAPGAVFKLKSPVESLKEKLIAGIGEGRENGFGAVLPHPGVAERLFPEGSTPRVVPKPHKNFGLEGFELWRKTKAGHLSASQISRVRELAGLDADKAIEYLERQKKDRPTPIWERWKEIIHQIEDGIRKDPQYMGKVLKVCQDLLVADKGEN